MESMMPPLDAMIEGIVPDTTFPSEYPGKAEVTEYVADKNCPWQTYLRPLI